MKEAKIDIQKSYKYCSHNIDKDTQLLDKVSTSNDLDSLEGKELDALYAMCMGQKNKFSPVELRYVEDTTLPEGKKDNIRKILGVGGDFSTNIIELKILQCEKHISDFNLATDRDTLSPEQKNLNDHLQNRLNEQVKPYYEELFIDKHSRAQGNLVVEFEDQYKEVKEALAKGTVDKAEWRKQSKFDVSVALYIDDVMEAAKNPSKSAAIEEITKLNKKFVEKHNNALTDKEEMLKQAKQAAISFVAEAGKKELFYSVKQFLKSWVGASDVQKIDKTFERIISKDKAPAESLIQNVNTISSPLSLIKSPTRQEREGRRAY